MKGVTGKLENMTNKQLQARLAELKAKKAELEGAQLPELPQKSTGAEMQGYKPNQQPVMQGSKPDAQRPLFG